MFFLDRNCTRSNIDLDFNVRLKELCQKVGARRLFIRGRKENDDVYFVIKGERSRNRSKEMAAKINVIK